METQTSQEDATLTLADNSNPILRSLSDNATTPRVVPDAPRIGPYILGKTLGVGTTGTLIN